MLETGHSFLPPQALLFTVGGLSAFFFSVILGNPYIHFLRKRYMGQYIREDGPQSHHAKAGTPTAGGVLILGSAIFGAVVLMIWHLINHTRFWHTSTLLVLGVSLAFGLLGFVDDYLKISKKKNKGVSGYTKLIIQGLLGLLLGLYVLWIRPDGAVNVFGLCTLTLGWLYPLFAILVITGTSNAVNLTDGLDGLASGTALMSFMTFSLLLLGSGFADLSAISQLFAGATLGFLVFNRHPARIFMGDTGSLALGGALAALAILGKMECWLLLLGAIYVVEALSVILQVISFKSTGKRLFRMSPLHHHFELGGWKETQVVYGFVTFQFCCCMLAVFLYR